MAEGGSSIEKETVLALPRAELEKILKVFAAKKNASSIAHKFRPRFYYDTPKLDLHAHNISLRVQYKPGKKGKIGGYEQTVKIEAGKRLKKAFVRKECKDRVPDNAPHLDLVTDEDAQALLKPYQGRALKHIFTAAIERRMLYLHSDQGQVEVAFDVGQLMSSNGKAHQDLVEIEIEVMKGGAKQIAAVRNEIMSLAPSARIQTLTKSQLGTQLYLQSKPPSANH